MATLSRPILPRWAMTIGMPALAAVLALIFVLQEHKHDAPTVMTALSGTCASAGFGSVLDLQPSGMPSSAGPMCSVMAIASYQKDATTLCRDFEALDTATATASTGLACRRKGAAGWTLIGAVELDLGPGSPDSFRPAGSSSADPIGQLRRDQGLGSALSDDAELAALAALEP